MDVLSCVFDQPMCSASTSILKWACVLLFILSGSWTWAPQTPENSYSLFTATFTD